MKQLDQSLPLSGPIAENVTSAQLVLKRSFTDIPSLFSGKELYVYSYEEKSDKSLEIRLNDATLSCMFDQANTCESSLLFLDDSNRIDPYINFCNQMYHYDRSLKRWKAKDHIVQIKKDEDDYVIVFRIS